MILIVEKFSLFQLILYWNWLTYNQLKSWRMALNTLACRKWVSNVRTWKKWFWSWIIFSKEIKNWVRIPLLRERFSKYIFRAELMTSLGYFRRQFERIHQRKLGITVRWTETSIRRGHNRYFQRYRRKGIRQGTL